MRGELYRRICFNALISNTDDHPRNHAFISLDRNLEALASLRSDPAAISAMAGSLAVMFRTN
jgi:hypothetical protein